LLDFLRIVYLSVPVVVSERFCLSAEKIHDYRRLVRGASFLSSDYFTYLYREYPKNVREMGLVSRRMFESRSPVFSGSLCVFLDYFFVLKVG